MSKQSYTASQVGMATAQDAATKMVFSSTRYDSFVIDPKNRPINQDKLMSLYDSIAARNLLSDNPILIDKGRVVVDGQHRLKVAEAMGVPIYYILSDNASIADVSMLASRRSAWTTLDYLHHWCAEGLDDYIRFRKFVEQNQWMPPTVAVMLCQYGDRKNLRQRFNAGQYDYNDEEFANRVVGAVLDFKAAGFTHWNNKSFIDVVAHLMANADYDHKRMIAKLAYNPGALRPCVTLDDYIANFNTVYNYKVRAGSQVLLKRLYTQDPKYRIDRKISR